MSLNAQLVVSRGTFTLDIALRAEPGEVVALLGPNGAGKTTALRALAGLESLTQGHIGLDGRDITGLPPEKRRVGVVFQDYLLFPHMSALDNVAFGPRRRGRSRAGAREIATDWLSRVGLADMAARKPRQLSGGQQQRVALARALAVNPDLLLLDEPLAALDARTRLDTRAELHTHLERHAGTTLLVTHDPLDALMLADRLVIIEDGRVVQEGDATEITARPRTDYIARLVGLNLYKGHGDGHAVTVSSGVGGVGGFVLMTADEVTGDSCAAFSPSAVTLHPNRPEGSARNTWSARVTGIQRHGDNLRVQLDGPIQMSADITPAAAAQLRLAPGQRVWAAVKAAQVRAYRY